MEIGALPQGLLWQASRADRLADAGGEVGYPDESRRVRVRRQTEGKSVKVHRLVDGLGGEDRRLDCQADAETEVVGEESPVIPG